MVKGALLVSGSRSIVDAKEFAHQVYLLASQREWIVICGDAKGVDKSVIDYCFHIKYPIHVYASGVAGLRYFKWHERADFSFVPGGTHKSCFVIRDEKMAQVTRAYPEYGFIGLWNGQSKGTVHTANFAKALGIPGILYKTNGEKMIWKFK